MEKFKEFMRALPVLLAGAVIISVLCAMLLPTPIGAVASFVVCGFWGHFVRKHKLSL